jgi:hypothetical protein
MLMKLTTVHSNYEYAWGQSYLFFKAVFRYDSEAFITKLIILDQEPTLPNLFHL